MSKYQPLGANEHADRVRMFMFRRLINGEWYCVIMPCDGWEGAEADAERYGWQLDGRHMGTVPAWVPNKLAMWWLKVRRFMFSPVVTDIVEDKP